MFSLLLFIDAIIDAIIFFIDAAFAVGATRPSVIQPLRRRSFSSFSQLLAAPLFHACAAAEVSAAAYHSVPQRQA